LFIIFTDKDVELGIINTQNLAQTIPRPLGHIPRSMNKLYTLCKTFTALKYA